MLGHARNHSAEMAASGSIYHDSNLGSEANSAGCWVKVGENVGRGPNAGVIHSALMNSPSHRANILGDFDASRWASRWPGTAHHGKYAHPGAVAEEACYELGGFDGAAPAVHGHKYPWAGRLARGE